MKKILFILGFVGTVAIAQQSIIKAPRDSTNAILYAGLGLPYLIEPTITNTTYDNTNRTALSSTGADTGRQYRHLWIYNPSTSLGVYVCVGDSTGCSTDMWKAPFGVGVVDDFAYFGAANNMTYIYYRISAGGTATPIIRWW